MFVLHSLSGSGAYGFPSSVIGCILINQWEPTCFSQIVIGYQ